MAERSETVRVDGHEIRITRPEKVLFPEDGITKGDLVRYYQQIAPLMLPWLEGRPLAMERFPDGIGRPGFFQKAAARYYPEWIRTATMRKAGGTVRHVVCDDAATLVYLANQACLTLHTWLSRAGHPDHPDEMIFDFDPSGADDLAAVIGGAQALRGLLEEAGLRAFVKSTGSRGLHVVVPLDGRQDFDAVRAYARSMAEVVVAREPDRYTVEQHKIKRGSRVFIDVNRNAYAQTAVANYAVRPRAGAPVSVPLDWSELGRKGFRPDGVTLRTVGARARDPWKDFWRHAGSLARARRA